MTNQSRKTRIRAADQSLKGGTNPKRSAFFAALLPVPIAQAGMAQAGMAQAGMAQAGMAQAGMAQEGVVTQWDQFAQSGITAAGPAMDELIGAVA